MCTIDSECVRFGKAALTLQKVDIKQSYKPYFYHYFLEKRIWKISDKEIWNEYLEISYPRQIKNLEHWAYE